MVSLTQDTQKVEIYTAWPDEFERTYQAYLGMSESRYIELFNFSDPPLYYVFYT